MEGDRDFSMNGECMLFSVSQDSIAFICFVLGGKEKRKRKQRGEQEIVMSLELKMSV